MNNKTNLDDITLWTCILIIVVLSHKTNGIITDSNELHCTHLQCPTKCPQDSYLKSIVAGEEEDFEDYEDSLFSPDSYIEEIGNIQELPPEVELHDSNSPQHILKERQKREVFFQEDIERCCQDQKCVCHKCEDVPKCSEGYVAVEIHEGQGTPGNCCSIFKCVPKQVCRVGGVKQSWWTGKCTKCSCFGDSELCMQICPEEEILQNCYSEYWQKPMMNGAFWKEGRCISCSCERGERRCLTPVCPKLDCGKTITLEDECCPKCIEHEIDERTESVHSQEKEEESTTESTTDDTPTEDLNEENNFTINHSKFPVVDKNLLNDTQSTTPLIENIQSSTATVAENGENTSSTFQPVSVEIFQKNISSLDSTTSTPFSFALPNSTLSSILEMSSSFSTSTEESKSLLQLESDANRTTEDPIFIIDSSTASTSIEVIKSVVTLEQDFSTTISTTEVEQISSTSTTETPEDLTTEDTLISNTAVINATQETSTSTPIVNYIESTSKSKATLSSSSTTAAAIEMVDTTVLDTYSEVSNDFTTAYSADTTMASSNVFSTSAATETTSSSESYTAKAISYFTTPMTSTTNTPLFSSSEVFTPAYTSASSTSAEYPTSSSIATSTDSPTSSSTSTTSSPYSGTSVTTTTSNLDESTTTAPEALKPLFQSYDNIIRNEASSSNQNQMRIMFDEIDYVVMIVLFTGSLLCISLGLIIRHTKNRKKMYSSIPNSETSLSQTSTNTVLTV